MHIDFVAVAIAQDKVMGPGYFRFDFCIAVRRLIMVIRGRSPVDIDYRLALPTQCPRS
jgi:hypothetical protein